MSTRHLVIPKQIGEAKWVLFCTCGWQSKTLPSAEVVRIDSFLHERGTPPTPRERYERRIAMDWATKLIPLGAIRPTYEEAAARGWLQPDEIEECA